MKCFLERHWDRESPLLVGYSGGSDSKALLFAAIEWGKASIHIAHVDHGWRTESRDEALALQKEAEQLGVPFHTIRLEKMTTESEARQLRLSFFRSLQNRFAFQAVLLGHHADDLAETVLKRIFEGAYLPRIYGMKPVSEIDGILVWRPLLHVSKAEIRQSLAARQISGLEDSSNYDSRYLRARMRSEMIPFLNQSFGKNISENLAILSERSSELDEYLSLRLSELKNRALKGPFGLWVDGRLLHRLELRHLLKHAASQEKILLPHPVLESILDKMEEQKANQRINVCHRTIYVDRGHFFLLAEQLPKFDQPLSVSGQCRSGAWIVEEIDQMTPWIGSQLQTLWRGEAVIQCFDGEPLLQLPPAGIRWPQKIPLFLRMICPVLMNNGRMVADFVSGKSYSGSRCVKIHVESEFTKSNSA